MSQVHSSRPPAQERGGQAHPQDQAMQAVLGGVLNQDKKGNYNLSVECISSQLISHTVYSHKIHAVIAASAVVSADSSPAIIQPAQLSISKVMVVYLLKDLYQVSKA